MHLRALKSITIIYIFLILLEPSLFLFLIEISRESFPLYCCRERMECVCLYMCLYVCVREGEMHLSISSR